MGRRQYRNPPIEEAVCEFRFLPGPEWDLTVPGRLHGKVGTSYGGKPRNQRFVEAGLQLGAKDAGSSIVLKEGFAKVQLSSEDGRRLLGVGPDILSVHVLRPYPGWEEVFRPGIEEALKAYDEVASPRGVKRIGLRYINRILLQEVSVHLEEYFTSPPRIPDIVPKTMANFFNRVECVYDDAPMRVHTTFGNARAPEGGSAFLLDIDMICDTEAKPLPLSDVMNTLDDLRQRERDVFEALITDKLREVFDAE